MDEIAATLVEAVDAAVPRWVEREVRRIWAAWRGEGAALPPDLAAAMARAAEEARAAVRVELGALLERDIDEQRTNPLSVLRAAVRYPTAVLAAAGIPEVQRDEFAERAFPRDHYDLSPATWRDVDESLHEPGLVWGAWKAQQHLRRRSA